MELEYTTLKKRGALGEWIWEEGSTLNFTFSHSARKDRTSALSLEDTGWASLSSHLHSVAGGVPSLTISYSLK